MLHGVNAGDIRTTNRESITDSIHALPTDGLSPIRPPAYELYCLRTSYSSSRVSWCCSSLMDALNVLLGHSVCFACEHAAGLMLHSLHVLTSMCHFFVSLLVARGSLSPLADQS